MRVVQGKEPPHFLAIFGGDFTVFSGGVAGAFDDVKRSVEVGSTYLLQIHGRYVRMYVRVYVLRQTKFTCCNKQSGEAQAR